MAQTAERGEARQPGGRRAAGAGKGQRRPPAPVPYNFRRPDKFSKDHIRSIQSIHEAFSRFTTNFLSAQVRSAAHVELAQIEQSTLGEYLDQFTLPTALFVSELDPLVGRIVVQLDLNITFPIIDRMLGGPGAPKRDRGGASVTEIEMLLLNDLGKGLYNEFINAWEQVAALRSPRVDVALSPAQLQGLLPSEVALVIRHEVRLLEQRGKLSICLPASTIEPLMPRLNARVLFANPRTGATADVEKHLAMQLERVRLNLSVILGRATIGLNELLALEPGDVICLDQSVHQPLTVRVENRPCFLGYAGQHAGHLAVRVVDRLKDEIPDLYPEEEDEA